MKKQTKNKQSTYGSFRAYVDFMNIYPLQRVLLFFVLSNSWFFFVNKVISKINRPRTVLIENDLESEIKRAILTVETHSSYTNDYTLLRLKKEFEENSAPDKCMIFKASEIKLDDKLTIPSGLEKELELVKKSLNCSPQAKIRLYYKGEKVHAAYLLDKNGKVIKEAFRHGAGFYNKDGVRLDKSEVMTKPLQLITPVGPKGVRISSGYGNRIHPVFKVKKFHAGIDVAAAKNSLIHAALDGVVTRTSYCRGYGTYVMLKHKNGLETLYGHMDSINKKTVIGAKVKQGDVLGKVGQTGTATAPHLHFETRINGKHVNPKSIKPMEYKLAGKELQTFKAEMESTLHEMKLCEVGV